MEPEGATQEHPGPIQMPRLPFFPERSVELPMFWGKVRLLEAQKEIQRRKNRRERTEYTTEYKTSHKRWGIEALKVKGLRPLLGHVI